MTSPKTQLARAIYILALEWGYTAAQVNEWLSDESMWKGNNLSLKLHEKTLARSKNSLQDGIDSGRFGVGYIWSKPIKLKLSK